MLISLFSSRLVETHTPLSTPALCAWVCVWKFPSHGDDMAMAQPTPLTRLAPSLQDPLVSRGTFYCGIYSSNCVADDKVSDGLHGGALGTDVNPFHFRTVPTGPEAMPFQLGRLHLAAFLESIDGEINSVQCASAMK